MQVKSAAINTNLTIIKHAFALFFDVQDLGLNRILSWHTVNGATTYGVT